MALVLCAVAVLSAQAWTRVFDRDPAVIGRAIRLNDQTLTVVGVMADEFVGLNDTPPDLWLPVTMHGPVIKQDLFGAAEPHPAAQGVEVIARHEGGQQGRAVRSHGPVALGDHGLEDVPVLLQVLVVAPTERSTTL